MKATLCAASLSIPRKGLFSQVFAAVVTCSMMVLFGIRYLASHDGYNGEVKKKKQGRREDGKTGRKKDQK